MNLKYIKNGFFLFSKLLSVVLFIVVIFTGIAIAEDKSDILKIRWVIDEAVRMNPGLQSAKLGWDASTERVLQEKALDDPVMGLTYFGEQVQTRVGEKTGRSNGFTEDTILRKTQVKRRGCQKVKQRYLGKDIEHLKDWL